MQNLQIFKNEKFGEMRTIEKNNNPYICLADVCKILEIGNVSQLKTRLKEDGVITNEVIDNLGRKQQAKEMLQQALLRYQPYSFSLLLTKRESNKKRHSTVLPPS